jgi:non-homologous end joining protein Ku
MSKSDMEARGKLILNNREYNVFLRVYGNGLMFHTVYADAEIRAMPEFDEPSKYNADKGADRAWSAAALEYAEGFRRFSAR